MPAGAGVVSPTTLNYAKQYSQALANAFPYSLYFGKLYATPTNGRYRWLNAKTIEIPTITTTGRVNASRDTIATAARNYDNAWETKTLTNERKWSTLVHPMDVDQTNLVTTISNITKTFNEFQKFPEMDAYTISKLYADYTALDDPDKAAGTKRAASTTALTKNNILAEFDAMMLKMDNKRVPVTGRVLYVTNEVNTILKRAQLDANNIIQRQLGIESGPKGIDRRINRLDEVEIVPVPAELMKTAYNFTQGWAVGGSAKQINMMLIHPLVVITPVSYSFAQLEAPSALSEGKWVYYEESFEDVFILNQQADGIQFNVTDSNLVVTASTLAVGG